MAIKYPLSLIVQAVDKATAPLRRINAQVQRMQRRFTAPFQRLGNRLAALGREAGFPRLQDGFKGVGSAVGNVGREVSALAKRLVATASIAGVALFAITRSAVDAGDAQAMMADRLKVSVDAYAQLSFAAAQADVSQEQFNTSMDQFNRRLGEAKAGTGSLAGLLKRVSPALLAQLKGAGGNEEAFRLMADAMSKLEDPGKRAALAAAAFGKSGTVMVGMLAEGNAKIDERRRRFLELAGSQEKFARGAGDLDNAMREASTAFLGLRSAALGELFPAFTELTKVLTELLAGNRGRLADWAREVGAAIGEWVKGGGVQRLVDGFKNFVAVGEKVVGMIGGWPVLLGGLALVIAGPLLGALAGLVTAVATLGAAIGFTPIGWLIAGLAALVAGAVLLWRNFDAIRAVVGPVFAPLGQALKGLWAQLQRLWALLAPVLMPVLRFLGKVLGTVLVAQVMMLGAALTGIAHLLTRIIKGFANTIDMAVAAGKAIVEWFQAAWEKVKPLVDLLREAFSEGGETAGAPRLLTQPEGARPILGAAGALAAGGLQESSARVAVDFANLPRGARVTADPKGTAALDLSMGYSMVTP